MLPTPQKGTAVYGDHRVLVFDAEQRLATEDVAGATETYEVALAYAKDLPAQLKALIRELFGRQVVWQFRVHGQYIYFWLPTWHPEATSPRLTRMQILDAFCQVTCMACGFAEIAVDLDTAPIDGCYPLGTAGETLARIVRWTCSS